MLVGTSTFLQVTQFAAQNLLVELTEGEFHALVVALICCGAELVCDSSQIRGCVHSLHQLLPFCKGLGWLLSLFLASFLLSKVTGFLNLLAHQLKFVWLGSCWPIREGISGLAEIL